MRERRGFSGHAEPTGLRRRHRRTNVEFGGNALYLKLNIAPKQIFAKKGIDEISRL